MVGTNGSIGIGVIQNKKVSASSSPPIEIDVAGPTPFYNFTKPVASVLYIKNSVPQTPDDQYTFSELNTRINFIPPLEADDFVMIIPFYQ